MSVFNISECYQACNQEYGPANPGRLFCKKACDSDGGIIECKTDYCSNLCIKHEIGGEEEAKPAWSKFFARAPGTKTSEDCLTACLYGCTYKSEENDDD
jgi:hypothetical protein